MGHELDGGAAVVALRVGMAAAYEQVRVARVMRSYPALVEAFAAGRLSYSKSGRSPGS
jgi:hypothetical protein